MQFRALLRRDSPLYQQWMHAWRLGGMGFRVEFRGSFFHRQGEDFVSLDDPLSDDAVMALHSSPHIQLEVTSLPVRQGMAPSALPQR